MSLHCGVWSVAGLVLCGVYAALIKVRVAMACPAGADFKGLFVFLPLPSALKMVGDGLV